MGRTKRGSSPATQTETAAVQSATSSAASAGQGADVGYTFEFQILDEKGNVKKTHKVSAKGNSEAEAIERAVAKLNVPEGSTYRYTGKFWRK